MARSRGAGVLSVLLAFLPFGCVAEGYESLTAEVEILHEDGTAAEGPWKVRYTWFEDPEAALAAPTEAARDLLPRCRLMTESWSGREPWREEYWGEEGRGTLAFFGPFQGWAFPFINPWYLSLLLNPWKPVGLWMEVTAWGDDGPFDGTQVFDPTQIFVVLSGPGGGEVHRIDRFHARPLQTTVVGSAGKSEGAWRIALVLRADQGSSEKPDP